MRNCRNDSAMRQYKIENTEISKIVRALEKDNILLILEINRKISILEEIVTEIKEKQCIPTIFIDVSNVCSPGDFLVQLLKNGFDAATNKRLFIDKMKRFFPQLEHTKAEIPDELKDIIGENNWKEEGSNIFIFLRDCFGDRIYFIVDGFSDYICNVIKNNKKEAEIFLKWLKSIRAKENGFRFIFVASSDINSKVKDASPLSSISDLRRVSYKDLDKEYSNRCKSHGGC